MRISDWSSDVCSSDLKMKTILGHEMTHTWTANELGKWYTEGDAVYYQARLPWQAGLSPIGEYLTDIKLTAARYYTSEVIEAPDKEVAPNFWDDLRYNVLSYDRGAMYFAMLNGEIVHQSGGTRSIDDLVRAMVAIQRDEGKEPTEQDWIALLRSEEHTSELQSLMRISYAVFCLKKKKKQRNNDNDA